MAKKAEALYSNDPPLETSSAATHTIVTIDGTDLQGLDDDYTIGLEVRVATWNPGGGGGYSGYCRIIGSVKQYNGGATLVVIDDGSPAPAEGAHAGVSDIVIAVSGTDILIQIVVPDTATMYHQAWVEAKVLSLADEV